MASTALARESPPEPGRTFQPPVESKAVAQRPGGALVDPRDPRGLNALKTGAFSRAALLPGESADERQALEDEYFAAFRVTTRPQKDVLLRLVDAHWRLARLDRAEQAMAVNAIRRAETRWPESVSLLLWEVARQENELVILRHCLSRLDEEIHARRGWPQEVLRGLSHVLDRVLGWGETVAEMRPAQVLKRGEQTRKARQEVLEAAQQQLDRMKRATKTVVDAAVAEAGMLEPKKADRMLHLRTTLQRAIARDYQLLLTLVGAQVFETVLGAGRFGKTNPPVGEDGCRSSDNGEEGVS